MRILCNILVLLFVTTAAVGQQINPVPDYIFRNQMSVGRNAATDTAAYMSIGPRFGAVKGFMPPMVVDTNAVTGTKRNGLLIFSVQLNNFAYWDSTTSRFRKITAEAIVDSLLYSTRAWRQKGDDSLGALIGLRVRFTDTASMLSPYLRKVDTTAMLTPYLRKVDTTAMLTPYVRTAGYGLTKGTQTLSVDTGLMATRLRVQKGIDSLAATEIDGSGTVNYVPKFTATRTLGNSQIFDNGTNVGIGTTSPGSPLHVQRANDGIIGIFRGTSNAQLLVGVSSGNMYYDASNGNANHTFQTNGTERMRLTAAGRLLVGTTTEGTNTVDIAGTLRSTQGANFATSSGSVGINTEAPTARLHVRTTSQYAANFSTTRTNDTLTSISLGGFSNSNPGVYGVDINAHTNLSASFASAMSFSTHTGSAMTERMRITSAGNVGIGTTSPSEALHVVGRGRFTTIDSTSSPINLLTSDVNGVIRKTSIAASGGVTGTGTASRIPVFTSSTAIGNSNIYVSANGAGFGLNDANPTQITNYGILNLAGSAGAVQYFKIADTIRGYFGMAAQTIGQPYTTSVLEITNSTSGDIRFTTASSEKVRLKNDGELVLGSVSTDAGNYRLQVNGSQYVSSSMNIANATVFDANNKLEIYGPAFIRNTATAGSFRFDSTAAIFVAVQDRAVISISGGSHTGSNAGPVLSIEHTWNTSGDVNLIRADVTNTASGSLSNFIRLSDGTNTFRVNKSAEIFTSAPTGGSSKGWRLGDVSVVSPTSPNRTLRVEVDGTVYYIHAKTSND